MRCILMKLMPVYLGWIVRVSGDINDNRIMWAALALGWITTVVPPHEQETRETAPIQSAKRRA